MHIPAFHFIGIEVRTNNQNNKSKQDIAALWGRFFAERIAEKITGKTSTDIYTVYTDYESDYTGNYTTLLGFKVASLNDIPPGLTGRSFGPANMVYYEVKGKLPEAVVETWKDIWKTNDGLERSYTFDLEVYGPDSQKGDQSKMEIYIACGVQPEA